MDEWTVIMQIIISVFVFLFGLCIGSFSNVLIYRMPLGINFAKGSSFCPKCEHELKWYDLFPLFSFLFLGGRCRYCKAKISPQYPVVEAVTGLLYLAAYWFLCEGELRLSFLGFAAATTALIVIAFIDFKHQIIPDSMWITVLIGGVIVYADEIVRDGFNIKSLVNRLIGFFCVSIFLLLIGMLYKGGMGGGDIKLMAAAGFLLGWQNIILALMAGALIGVIYLGITRSLKKGDMKKAVPFGPHLAAGIFVAMYFGTPVLNWYTGLWS